MRVTALEDDWPERGERDRKWLPYDEARRATLWREEMAACWDEVPAPSDALEALLRREDAPKASQAPV